MIASLCGTLLEISGASLVLEVAGVGYELGVSQTTINALPEIGTPSVLLYCRLRPTEQAINLYGFATKEERAVFDKLVTVSGVGPKVALAVLSSFIPTELAQIIALQDEKRMQSVSGVGKKMAGRLLLELKGLFATDEEFQKLAGLDGKDATSSARGGNTNDASLTTALAEATEALLGLGYAPKEADIALQTVLKEHIDHKQDANQRQHAAKGDNGPGDKGIPQGKKVLVDDEDNKSDGNHEGAGDRGINGDHRSDINKHTLTVEQLLKEALTILGGGHHVGS